MLGSIQSIQPYELKISGNSSHIQLQQSKFASVNKPIDFLTFIFPELGSNQSELPLDPALHKPWRNIQCNQHKPIGKNNHDQNHKYNSSQSLTVYYHWTSMYFLYKQDQNQ